MPPGQKRKTGPLCSSHLHKGPALSYLAAILNGCKGRFISFGRGFALCRGCAPKTQSLSRGYDYFFFFEVFFATFLVAAFAVFFAFFAFLAMLLSVIPKVGSVQVDNRHAYIQTTPQLQN